MREKVFTKSVRVLIVLVFLEAAVFRGTTSHIMILCTASGWIAFVCGCWLRRRPLVQTKQVRVEHMIRFEHSVKPRGKTIPQQQTWQPLPVGSQRFQLPQGCDKATWVPQREHLRNMLWKLKNQGYHRLIILRNGVLYAVNGNGYDDLGFSHEMPKEEEWYALVPLLEDMGIQVKREHHQLYLVW